MSKICNKCGKVVEDNISFCPECGNNLICSQVEIKEDESDLKNAKNGVFARRQKNVAVRNKTPQAKISDEIKQTIPIGASSDSVDKSTDLHTSVKQVVPVYKPVAYASDREKKESVQKTNVVNDASQNNNSGCGPVLILVFIVAIATIIFGFVGFIISIACIIWWAKSKK